MFHKIFFGERNWPTTVFLQSSREVNTVLISQFKLGGWAQALFDIFSKLSRPWFECGWDQYVIPLSTYGIMKIKWAKIWKFLVYKQLVNDQASIEIQNYLSPEPFFFYFLFWNELNIQESCKIDTKNCVLFVQITSRSLLATWAHGFHQHAMEFR